MPCYHPITGYRSRYVNQSGKRSIVFSRSEAFSDLPIEVPCGRCAGCRLEYSRQWAIRCMHESQTHTANSFITLTYAPENLPADHSINKQVLQNFFKLFRKKLHKRYGSSPDPLNPKKNIPNVPIRYFACGEYGEQRNRPHYHALIFGYDFPDKKLWSKKNGNLLFRSPFLESIWPHGYSSIGHVTFESAAYVARYVMKKRKGPDDLPDKFGKFNDDYYDILDQTTGEVFHVEREFCLMSRNPGIGKKWYQMYGNDTKKDFITLRGNKYKIPKYYDSILEQENELELQYKKDKRRREASKRKSDNTIERLRVKELIKTEQIKLLKRGFENNEN